MNLVKFLTVGTSLDRRKEQAGRFKVIAKERVVPCFARSGAECPATAADPGGRAASRDFSRASGALLEEEFLHEEFLSGPAGTDLANTDQAKFDNNQQRSEEGGSSFLRHLFRLRRRRRTGSMLMQHVTVVRNDLSVSDLELVPAKPIVSTAHALDVAAKLSGAGVGSRLLGMFRSMRTLY